jgi:hypothetical protein
VFLREFVHVHDENWGYFVSTFFPYLFVIGSQFVDCVALHSSGSLEQVFLDAFGYFVVIGSFYYWFQDRSIKKDELSELYINNRFLMSILFVLFFVIVFVGDNVMHSSDLAHQIYTISEEILLFEIGHVAWNSYNEITANIEHTENLNDSSLYLLYTDDNKNQM